MPNFGTLQTNFGTKLLPSGQIKNTIGTGASIWDPFLPFLAQEMPNFRTYQKNFGTEFLQSGHNKKTLGHSPQFETHKKPLGPTGSYLGHNLTNNWDTKP